MVREPLRLAILALLIVAACEQKEFPRNPPFETVELRAEDIAVYDAVLPLFAKGRSSIRLIPHTVLSAPAAPSANGWRTPADAAISHLELPGDVVRDLNDRNKVHASLAGYRPRDLRVLRAEPGKLPVLSFSLPGYSRSRDAALVEISITDSPMSGGGELVYLKKIGTKWTMVAKQRMWIS